MKNGYILGLLTACLILILSLIIEFLKLKKRFKKYNKRLKLTSFLFKYYYVIYELKCLEKIEIIHKFIGGLGNEFINYYD